MIGTLTLADAMSMGSSYFIALILVVGTRKLWGDFWPWFTNNYWKNREERWTKQFETTKMREESLLKQAQSFLDALEKVQNGFSVRNTEQHEAIIAELRALRGDIMEYKELNSRLTSILVSQVESAAIS